MDDDYALALQLQEQFDHEANDAELDGGYGGGGPLVTWKPEKPLSIVDASWETLDPTPDVRAMFLEFNDRFFWAKLSGVEVKWSPRMTLCAGVCSYEGRGGLCSIRLSEPLLKLRPRKDLVERCCISLCGQTLLHEMIHALLFVTQNNRDRDGHGPEFCKHMNRINKDAGTSITVYHNFNDEVDVYRQHWWRCDGPCQTRKPYFGFVKRAMNRAPSALDPWWGDHQRTCGGNYAKVKEPEGYGKKEAKKDRKMLVIEKSAGARDIRDVIAFSGKGFVLGGNPSSASYSPGPASSSVSKPVTPSPPARVVPAVRPPATQGHKTLGKKSVGNTSVFVNINGSPVRITKPHGGRGDDDGVGGRDVGGFAGRSSISGPGVGGGVGGGDGGHGVFSRRVGGSDVGCRGMGSVVGGRGAGGGKNEDPNRLKQTSIGIFFNNKSTNSFITDSPKKTNSTTLTSVAPSAFNNHLNYDNLTSSPSPSERPGNAAATTPQWKKKRPLDDSAGVFELFNKRLKMESQEHEDSTPTSSYAAASSSSSLAVTVRCPVCQAGVQESEINEHLDSCLC
ncbi:DNA-dependent metalloprotease SPRTN isoform X1 [Phyllopteryx taeniolatus]|uniref:DNA-dependent metalloprotease SPRTN isoform X1 n=1 Tax=Phyllopteryx taeniolatus TaxID=161469 RepID=UPI002AD25093|nr:DNA-dependent metalloprotease SPRTN isoform X1 [Phyllopteryx taeniolatus]